MFLFSFVYRVWKATTVASLRTYVRDGGHGWEHPSVRQDPLSHRWLHGHIAHFHLAPFVLHEALWPDWTLGPCEVSKRSDLNTYSQFIIISERFPFTRGSFCMSWSAWEFWVAPSPLTTRCHPSSPQTRSPDHATSSGGETDQKKFELWFLPSYNMTSPVKAGICSLLAFFLTKSLYRSWK